MFGCVCNWTVCAVIVALVLAVLYFLCDHVPRLNVKGKHAVITGGSQGIGKELAKLLVAKGANVTIVARKQAIITEALQELAAVNKAGVRTQGLCADVGDRKAVTEVINQCARAQGGLGAMLSGSGAGSADGAGGHIDVLVCNAGYSMPALLEDQPDDEFDKTMRVNYLGCVYTIRAALPHMTKGGRIVLVGSMAGLTGVAGYASYSPSKFAVRGLAEALCMELRPRGISVSLVCPPDVDTPGYQHENLTKPEETRVVDGLVAKPQDVASDIFAAIEKYRFLVTSGFDGYLLGLLCHNTVPVTTVWEAALQGVATGLLRVVMLGYQKFFAYKLQAIYDRKHKAAAAAGVARGAAADAKTD